MNKQLALFPLLLFAITALQAQTSSNPLLNPDVEVLREHIYAGIPDELKHDRWDRRTYRFADISAGQISDLINSGDIYTDQPQLEAYLNKIMEMVMPDELKADSIVHAYIIADPSYNAFMTPSGSMFINIGLITEASDEATIASVLAHEMAHYLMQHSLNRFVRSESGDFRSILFRNNAASRFSIQNEFESDSLAMHWLKKSGYDLKGMLRSFEIMKQRERHALSLYEDRFEMEETSHPLPLRRIAKYEEFIQQQDSSEMGKPFLLSKFLFKKLKEEAKAQSLKSLLASFQYTTLVERAFKFHILDPNDPSYVYYLLEGIRRKCYMDATMWKKNFITYRYYENRSTGNGMVKDPIEDHLFTKMRPDLLLLTSFDEQNVKADFYWEEQPKFTTYEEAFIFYYRVAKALNMNEALLTNALSIVSDSTARAELLKEYLSKENIIYREYAENLLNGTIYQLLTEHKLTVISDFNVSIRQGDETIVIHPSDEDKKEIRAKMDSAFGNDPSRTLIFMDDLRQNNIAEYHKFEQMQNFSFIRQLSKGNRTELHIIEPGFWKTFKEYGVNEIEFVNCRYLEARKSEKDKDTYLSALQNSYKELFDQEKRTRDLQVVITRLREKENSVMKLRHFAEHSMYFRETAHAQIPKFLKISDGEMDERAVESDGRYRYYKD